MDEARLKGGAERLWDLIARRAERGADTQAIDRRIWDLFGERWAIVFTDLAGFSRRVEEFGIIHFLQIIYEHKQLLLPVVEEHDGVLVKTEGDSMLLLFRTPRRALDCCVCMRKACENVNGRRTPEEQILLCSGIGFGELLRIGDQDVWGREVNAAAKLGEDRARAGEILVTAAARDEILRHDARGLKLEALSEPVAGTEASYRLVEP